MHLQIDGSRKSAERGIVDHFVVILGWNESRRTSSFHQGTNMLFCKGSVRFLSEQSDPDMALPWERGRGRG